ncbi:MAG: hypothetical protein A3G33_00325 [Omnitrophica bacterium RIFCSPLOWO2_12_FULL_44_17]|uniref:FAD dependent oxidoreductase domain-containing protein n=1 Tax=Candidatus Danuiimicrobium aquiferis TaxID=1801832 RepID=A0A1G1KV11_9BACT|nr:MAG: hypothetical protein A3B72_01345 [Omnitrophica bacterium RIFCSPHIGHO2_02_FULL_45_28]OGW96409.1 MAG: hypothetical protein A3G33_00325 [Omnitrophica bacterium RIFCSPLOWO2_12_FULL_44_17]OGX02148.1 MAG: hypothetical protein A3J12_03600 [Omnitrophica bacterium RIFCSPLOWO2_02_FULL_44_11]
MARSHYDLLVVGGGINGAAVAHIAQKSGLKTALIDKGDFASGTSSKSTKLIHGGIRYLENMEFGLVKESLKERYIQLRSAPFLVKSLAFVIPVYKGDRRPLWMMRLGVFLYDFLAGKLSVQHHEELNVHEIVRLIPGIKHEGLEGGVLYYDAQMDDARLCLENILAAAEVGADVANYIDVVSFIKQNGKVAGVKCHDLIKHALFEIRAEKIICAVGPWTNRLLKLDDPNVPDKVRTTKGIHLVYRGRISDRALLLPTQKDKRIFFMIPWMKNTLIGTTDTDYEGDPDQVTVEESDIEYLFEGARRVFPNREFRKQDIVTSFAGLRPLVRKWGRPSDVSRKHVIFQSKSGITFVIGGKYTTYRKIARDCVKKATGRILRAPFRLYGKAVTEIEPAQVAKEYGIELETAKALISKYGSKYVDVLAFTKRDPSLKEKFCNCNPFIKAQIVYSLTVEMAQTADDILARRLSISYFPCESNQCKRVVQQLVQTYRR